MAYNPIAPTSSRENRKRPTNVPQGGIIVLDEDGDWAIDTSGEADAHFVVDEDGDLSIDDSAESGLLLARVGPVDIVI